MIGILRGTAVFAGALGALLLLAQSALADGILAAHGLRSGWYTGRNGEPEVVCVQLKRGESAPTFNYQTRNGPLT